jgi:protein required for attachment to host cells
VATRSRPESASLAQTTTRSAVEAISCAKSDGDQFAPRIRSAGARTRDAGSVIAAPPSALADLRKALNPNGKTKVLLQMNKDLTNHPVWQIERNIIAWPDEV